MQTISIHGFGQEFNFQDVTIQMCQMRTNCKQAGSASLHGLNLRGTDQSYNPELFFFLIQPICAIIYRLLHPQQSIRCNKLSVLLAETLNPVGHN